nr:flagellar basal-body rod protein FlgF [uncultured Anaeromusa sp.]
MIRGIYAAASGMIAEGLRTDVTANNLANVNTTGFKKEIAVNKDFEKMLLWRINDGMETPQIGSVGAGAAVDQIVTDHSQGSTRSTQGSLDVAIAGDGFFVVQTPQGQRYTRAGSFAVGANNQLVTMQGYAVLGRDGQPIVLEGPGGGSRVNITSDGVVEMNATEAGGVPTEVGRLQVVSFADAKRLAKEGQNLFTAPGGDRPQPVATPDLQQGYLEMSNVNAVQEMVNLITAYRAYEIDSKAVQSEDSLLDKAVNEVGRS